MKNSLKEILNMIQVNELKQSLMFYQKVTKLFHDIISYLNIDVNLIIENISGLRKMSTAAKILTDASICKDRETKVNLLKFLKEILIMLKALYSISKSDQINSSTKEFSSIVKSTLVN